MKMKRNAVERATFEPDRADLLNESDSINGRVLTDDELQILIELNKHYCHVVLGGKHRIMISKPCPIDRTRMTFEHINEFYHYFAHREKIAGLNQGKAWFQWSGKIMYSNGIGYYPDPALLPNNMLNTFQGFGCKPITGDVSLQLDFIQKIICGGDDKAASHFIQWLAHMVQKPAEKPSVAVLLKSEQGTGKGTLYKLLKKILGANAHQVNGHYQLTGRFNSVISGRLLIFGDEVDLTSKAVFDKTKGIISEPTISLELKGIEPEPRANFARFMFAGNHDYLLKAGTRERRFLVLEPSTEKIDKREYWQTLNDLIKGEGANHFFEYLTTLDISNFNPYQAPATKGLIDEKLDSLTPILAFFFAELVKDKLFEGAVRLYASQLVDSYRRWLEDNSDKASLASVRSQVGKFMSSCGITPLGRSDVSRGIYYELPLKEQFQQLFAAQLGHNKDDIF